MHRRTFLQSVTVGAAAVEVAAAFEPEPGPQEIDVSGFTLMCEFDTWKVFEDLRTRDGDIVFVSMRGVHRVLPKSAEACFADAEPAHLGLNMEQVGLSGPDLLADK